MDSLHDLAYKPNSFGPDFTMEAVSQFVDWFNGSPENPRLKLDPCYLDHVKVFNGGVPTKNKFQAQNGKPYLVRRFLNWCLIEAVHPLAGSSVENVWSFYEERLGEEFYFLIPFAELANSDLLCFDLRFQPHTVVVWDYELSQADKPHTVVVSDTFRDFLSLLHV